jgi:large subunit ribosomal protein L31e
MADKILEREYVIPLRRAWQRVPAYERSGRAIKAIKIFIAKHMKVPERDTDKVKLDVYFNNEIWFRGRANPPAKVKVKAKKEGDLVHVTFVHVPEHVKFLKAKHEKRHKKSEKKSSISEKPAEQPKEETKTEEQKTDEKEKEKAVEEMNIKQAEQQAKAQKHISKVKAPEIHRMALKK